MTGRTLRVPLVVGLLALTVAPTGAAVHTPEASNYRWVRPPDGLAATPTPVARRTDLPATPDALLATEVWTGDLQLVVALPALALEPRADRTAVQVELEPVDPATLGGRALPMAPNGNAYVVRLQDGADALDVLNPPGQMHLVVPHQPATLYWSEDGSSWSRLDTTEMPGGELVAPLKRSGVYLAGARHTAGWGAAPWALVAGTAATLGLLVLLLRRPAAALVDR